MNTQDTYVHCSSCPQEGKGETPIPISGLEEQSFTRWVLRHSQHQGATAQQEMLSVKAPQSVKALPVPKAAPYFQLWMRLRLFPAMTQFPRPYQ